MTEHSIEELKRQLDAARGKKLARVKASGWLGETVERDGTKFVVFDAEFLSGGEPWRLACNQIKADGKLSLKTRYLYLSGDKPAKLGKYVPLVASDKVR